MRPTDPPPVVLKQDATLINDARHYELITPLFGGGEQTMQADSISVVRASEVRGQLRFWWRATRGGKYTTLEDLKKDEDALWGAAGSGEPHASKVCVAITCDNPGSIDYPFEVIKNKWGKAEAKYRQASKVPAYVAFPMQPEQKSVSFGMQLSSVRVGVAFKLQISYPVAYKKDIDAALWAWETFGGIGARTRRGFGALYCIKVNDTLVEHMTCQQAGVWLQDQLQKHVVEGTPPAGVPHLSSTMLLRIIPSTGESIITWKNLIGNFSQFRQFRLSLQKGPGRNQWPEADAIRRLTTLGGKEATSNRFPRGQLGLPIVFHFIGAGEPGDTNLEGQNHDRYASRLILRPLRLAGGVVGLAAVLHGPALPPGGLKLAKAPGNPSVEGLVTSVEANQIQPLKGQVDPLQAFIDQLPERFKEFHP